MGRKSVRDKTERSGRRRGFSRGDSQGSRPTGNVRTEIRRSATGEDPGQIKKGVFPAAGNDKQTPVFPVFKFFQRGPLQLGITAGYHERGTGMIPQKFPYHAPRFLLGFGSNRTGVHYKNIGAFRRRKQGKTFPAKSVGNSFAFKLVELAAQCIHIQGRHRGLAVSQRLTRPVKAPAGIGKLRIKVKRPLVGCNSLGKIPGVFPGVGKPGPPCGVSRNPVHRGGKGYIGMPETAQTYVYLSGKVIDGFYTGPFGRQSDIFLKILQGFGIPAFVIIYLAQNLDDPRVIAAEVLSCPGVIHRFLITVKHEEAPAYYHMGFEVIAVGVYFVPANLNGPFIIAAPVFRQGVGPCLGKSRRILKKQKENKNTP
jgi:hypothetical protein